MSFKYPLIIIVVIFIIISGVLFVMKKSSAKDSTTEDSAAEDSATGQTKVEISDHLQVDDDLQSKMDSYIASGDSEGALKLMDHAIANNIAFKCEPCEDWSMKRDGRRIYEDAEKVKPVYWKNNLPVSFMSFSHIMGQGKNDTKSFPCAAKDSKGVWRPGQWNEDDRNCHTRGDSNDEKIEVSEKDAQFLATSLSHWSTNFDPTKVLNIGEYIPCKFKKRAESTFDVLGWTKSSDIKNCYAGGYESANGDVISFLNHGEKPSEKRVALKEAPNDSWKLYDRTSSNSTQISWSDFSKYFKNRSGGTKIACAVRPTPDGDPFVVGTLIDDVCHVAHADGVFSEKERMWLPAYDVVSDGSSVDNALTGSTPACMAKDDNGKDLGIGNVQNDLCAYVTSKKDDRLNEQSVVYGCFIRDANDPSVSREGFDIGDGTCLPREILQTQTTRNWKPIGRYSIQKSDQWVDDFEQVSKTDLKYKGFKLGMDPKKGWVGEVAELDIVPCAASIGDVWVPGYALEKNNCNIVHPDRDAPVYADRGIKYAKKTSDVVRKPLAFGQGVAGRVPCMVDSPDGVLIGYVTGDSCRYLHTMGQTEGQFDISKMAIPKTSKKFQDVLV
jgi:hypothetical protein